MSAGEPRAVSESHSRDVAWSSGEEAGMSHILGVKVDKLPWEVIPREKEEKGSGDRALETPDIERWDVCVKGKNRQRSKRRSKQ